MRPGKRNYVIDVNDRLQWVVDDNERTYTPLWDDEVRDWEQRTVVPENLFLEVLRSLQLSVEKKVFVQSRRQKDRMLVRFGLLTQILRNLAHLLMVERSLEPRSE